MAATTRTITDTIYKLDGTPWEGATVRVDRVDRPMIDSDGTIGDSVVTGTTDADGDVSLTVAVPPSGAGRYRLTRPVESGQPVDVTYFYLAAGDAISVGEILAASASALSEDAVLTLLSAYLSKTNNLSDLASAATARTNLGLGTAATAATGDFEAAGAVAAHTGASTGAHAATAISVTPAGNLAATDVQAALEEIQGDVDGMISDVDDLTTTTGSSTNMLRVAAAGGLEYRTPPQVLSDIGAAPTASPTFTGIVTLPTTVASVIKPGSDSTTALQLANAAGTAVVTVDTTNKRLEVAGDSAQITLVDTDGGNKKWHFNAATGAFSFVETGVSTPFIINDGVPSNTFVLDTFGAKGYLVIQGAGSFEGQANVLQLRVKAHSTQTSNIVEVQNNAGGALFVITGSGNVGMGGVTPTAVTDIAASTTNAASLRIRGGTAPTTPNDGDIYYDGSNLLVYVSSAWYTLDKTAV